jgi:hypothetical protein
LLHFHGGRNFGSSSFFRCNWCLDLFYYDYCLNMYFQVHLLVIPHNSCWRTSNHNPYLENTFKLNQFLLILGCKKCEKVSFDEIKGLKIIKMTLCVIYHRSLIKLWLETIHFDCVTSHRCGWVWNETIIWCLVIN